MLTRTLVATLFVVGVVVGGALAATTYVQDFEGVSSGTPLENLPGWGIVEVAGAFDHEVTDTMSCSHSPDQSAWMGRFGHVYLDFDDPAVLGFNPTYGELTVKFCYRWDDDAYMQTGVGDSTNQWEDANIASNLSIVNLGVYTTTDPLYEDPPGPWQWVYLDGNEAGTIPANTWYDIVTVYDLDNKQYTTTMGGYTGTVDFVSDVSDLGNLKFFTVNDPGNNWIDHVELSWVPEPATLCLFGLGGIFAVLRRRR